MLVHGRATATRAELAPYISRRDLSESVIRRPLRAHSWLSLATPVTLYDKYLYIYIAQAVPKLCTVELGVNDCGAHQASYMLCTAPRPG